MYWAGYFEGDYTQSLYDALKSNGVEVILASDAFLQRRIPPGSPIHVHWLEAYGSSWAVEKQLQKVLTFYSGRNPLIFTVHNLQPHGLPLSQGRAFYSALLPFFDHAIHLGPESMAEMEKMYTLPRRQEQHRCPHHLLPSRADTDQLPPWGEQRGVWITLGRLRAPADKHLLGQYFRQGRKECRALYIHRYPHLIQRKIFKEGWRQPRLLRQEWAFRWWNRRVHLNFGNLTLRELSAWLRGADRLLLPRTRHLNSGVPFLAAPFRIPIQAPTLGHIAWHLEQLGYQQVGYDLFHPISGFDAEAYQRHAIARWKAVYRSIVLTITNR